jgi:hypothetical protein
MFLICTFVITNVLCFITLLQIKNQNKNERNEK